MTGTDLHTEEYDFASLDDRVRRELYELWAVVEKEERPSYPATPYEGVAARLLNPPKLRAVRRWVARDPAGRLLGTSSLSWMRTDENKHLAWFDVNVWPDLRGGRIGCRLLGPIIEAARHEGRTVLGGDAKPDSPGAGFLLALGAEQKMLSRESELRCADVDRGLLEGWVARAAERAEEYRLVQWDNACPADTAEAFATFTGVMNTAPRDDLDEEDWVPTLDRLRDAEDAYLRQGNTWWTVCAVHQPTGAFAGYTELGFSRWQPWLSDQGDTGVDPPHRNRGLGRWVKAANLLRLLDEKPEVEVVRTWNANSNDAMLGLNVEMGFRPTLYWSECQVSTDVLAEAVGKRL